MIHRTKLFVRQYHLLFKTDHPGVVLVTGDLSGPLDLYGPFSQRHPIRLNGKRHRRVDSLVPWATD